MAPLCCSRPCLALTRKNIALKARRPVMTTLELIIPVVLVVAMVLIKNLFSTNASPATQHLEDFGTIQPLQALAARLVQQRKSIAVVGLQAQAFIDDASTLYTAFNGSTFGGPGFTSPALRSLSLPALGAAFSTFSSPASLQLYVESMVYGDATHPPIFAAILFHSGAPAWSYTLRLNSSDMPGTSPAPVNTMSMEYTPAPLKLYLSASKSLGGAPVPGLLSLQLAVDRWILGTNVSTAAIDPVKAFTALGAAIASTGNAAAALAFRTEVASLDLTTPAGQAMVQAAQLWLASESRAPQQVDFIPFPTPSFTANAFYTMAAAMSAIFFALAYAFPVNELVRCLVQEKELRLREVLKQMGARDWDMWGSWILTYSIFHAVLALILAGVSMGVYPHSNYGLLFVLIYLYGLASTTWSLLVSVFFVSTRTASVLGSMLWIAGFLATLAVTSETSSGTRALISLLAPSGLGMALDTVGGLESSGQGLTAATAAGTVINNWTVAWAIGMLACDVVLYLLLACYLDAVLPSWAREFGAPKPWYFPCSRSYWSETCSRGKSLPIEMPLLTSELQISQPQEVKVATGSTYIQGLDSELQAKAQAGRCIAVQGLRKEFNTPGGVKVAVHGLDVSFFEGQVTCLLGHNGAGKTTTLQMLAGLIPPTSGTATAFGYDILQDQETFRSILGVCPQHDVLWPDLTVHEHLVLFSALKGVPEDQVARECAEGLAALGMADKAHAKVNTLSGGMKRKLSIMLAFLGGSKVVFLDEPTSGVDPYSRRAMWELIQSQRKGRVIVLTTHFMDEADILGDKIAIMDAGELHCAGTPNFLKEQFGVGYTCTLVKNKEVKGDRDAAILAVVQEHVPEAVLASSAGSEMLIRFPFTRAAVIPSLIRGLCDPTAALGIVDVGVGITSLEDVFLAVANQTHGEEGKGKADAAPSDYSIDVPSKDESDMPLDLNLDNKQQAATPLTHLRAVLIKRMAAGRRDYRSLCCLVLLPVLLLAIGAVASATSYTISEPSYTLSTRQFNVPGARGGSTMAGPSNAGASTSPKYPNYVPVFTFKSINGTATGLPALTSLLHAMPQDLASTDSDRLLMDPAQVAALADFNGYVRAGAAQPMADYSRMSSFLAQDAGVYAASKYGALLFTATGSIIPGQTTAATVPADNALTVGIFVNTTASHAAPVFLNLLSTTLLRRAAGITDGTTSGPSITTTVHPLPLTASAAALRQALLTVPTLQPLMLALAVIPAAAAFFVMREREVGAKHQQTLSGLHIPAYWAANWIFDTATSALVVLLLLGLLAAYNIIIVETERDRALATALLLLGYSGAGTSFTYLISHAFSSPSAAQAVVVMSNILLFAIIQASSFLSFTPSTCGAFPSLYRFLGLHPMYAAGQGFVAIANLDTQATIPATCNAMNGKPFTMPPAATSALQMDIAGWNVVYLAIECVVYLLLAMLVDHLSTSLSARHRWARLRGTVAAKTAWTAPEWLKTVQQVVGYCLLPFKWPVLFVLWFYGRFFNLFTFGRMCKSFNSNNFLAWMRGAKKTDDVEQLVKPDADVAAEVERVDRMMLLSVPEPTSATYGYGSIMPVPAPAKEAVLLQHLKKQYPGGKVAVHDLSFGVPGGQVFGFLGINGAGKSTTMAMLTGLTLPTAGQAQLGGLDIVQHQWQVNKSVGYCPQFDALFDTLTVREHIQYYARLKGVDEERMESTVAHSVAHCDLTGYENALAGALSGGNKRKLSVAISLIGRPSVVFLDEPSTGVDPVARRKLWGIISRVATQLKCSVILTTHSMEEAEALCSTIGIMVAGRLRCLGTAQRLRSLYGSGFTCDVRMGQASAQAVQTAVQQLKDAGLCSVDMVSAASLGSACTALGKASFLDEVLPNGRGWAVFAALGGKLSAQGTAVLTGTMPAEAFCTWYAEEQGVDDFLAAASTSFHTVMVHERQGRTLKLHMEASLAEAGGAMTTTMQLASMFEKLEVLRTGHGLESATIAQPTLEQVFNSMAAAGAAASK